ncbi:hypothetical protein COU20_03785 [Candidatus Kaiserbacteria bacterium CG10_big_fil_rev_8_21_14_0_10_59_10]|uniref:SMC-Scp complex subunit ScpB n=1 Tax=Candidatus Kaiserbacteria bacterium CG10_big_fil_rev_8_21_14_0_10_59_10 TaxID=1974612 RepID=A0A2H0U7E9_9BACT|nr:MAG: hypothetical protein COU20_03785 [Candidatus Kaiserbacteria bacterium CG10_big_fil_rev_8_21_14_0_10_59_10]
MPEDAHNLEKLALEAEALLFAEGAPISLKKLASALACDTYDILRALDALEKRLAGTGLALVRTDTDAALTTSPAGAEAVGRQREKDDERAIGDAGLEVIAILLYEGPATRADIDYIRGVNSSSTIRTLLSRGLIERERHAADAREFLYKPSTELLAHLGVGSTRELPEYDTIASELAEFKSSAEHDAHDAGTASDDTAGERSS